MSYNRGSLKEKSDAELIMLADKTIAQFRLYGRVDCRDSDFILEGDMERTWDCFALILSVLDERGIIYLDPKKRVCK